MKKFFAILTLTLLSAVSWAHDVGQTAEWTCVENTTDGDAYNIKITSDFDGVLTVESGYKQNGQVNWKTHLGDFVGWTTQVTNLDLGNSQALKLVVTIPQFGGIKEFLTLDYHTGVMTSEGKLVGADSKISTYTSAYSCERTY